MVIIICSHFETLTIFEASETLHHISPLRSTLDFQNLSAPPGLASLGRRSWTKTRPPWKLQRPSAKSKWRPLRRTRWGAWWSRLTTRYGKMEKQCQKPPIYIYCIIYWFVGIWNPPIKMIEFGMVYYCLANIITIRDMHHEFCRHGIHNWII